MISGLLASIASLALPTMAAAESIFQPGFFADDLYVSAPTGLAPATDTTRWYPADVLQFSWGHVPGTDSYQIQLADHGTNSAYDCSAVDAFEPDALAIDLQVGDNSYVPDLLPPASEDTSADDGSYSDDIWLGTYCWRVRAVDGATKGVWSSPYRIHRNWSGNGQPTGLLFYNDQTGSIPRSSSDADYGLGSVSTKVTGYLQWNAVSGASGYDVQVSSNRSFADSAIALSRDKVKGTRVALVHLPDDTYFWRVRAIAPNGVESAWANAPVPFDNAWVEPTWNDQSNVWPDDDPTLANAADDTETEVRIGWTPMRGASYYEVQASIRPGCFWETAVNAPNPYGDWVNDPEYTYDPDGWDDGNPADDITVLADRRPDQCRITQPRQFTINNWMTLGDLFADEVFANIGNLCWAINPPTCRRVYLPNSTTGDYGDASDAISYEIFWRVRPVYQFTQATETGWLIGAGNGEVFGRWLEHEVTVGPQTYPRPYRFGLNDLATTTPSTASRCEDPNNPVTPACMVLVEAEMEASNEQLGVWPPIAPDERSTSMQLPVLKWEAFKGNDHPIYTGGYIVQIAADPDFDNIVKHVWEPAERVTGYGFQKSYAPTWGLPDNSEDTGFWWRATPCESSLSNILAPLNPCTALYYGAAIGNEDVADPDVYDGSFPYSGDLAAAQFYYKESGMKVRTDTDFQGSNPLLSFCEVQDGETTQDPCTDTAGITSADHYEVNVARDPFMTEDLHTYKTTVPRFVPYEPSSTIGRNAELEEGLWYWRVRAIDKDGIEGGWSLTTTFVKRTPAPVRTSPLTVSGTNAVITWAPIANADSYEIQWSQDPSFQTGFQSSQTRQVGWLFSGTPGTTYYWRVRASVGGHWGLWSDVDDTGPTIEMTYRSTLRYIVSRTLVPAGQKVFIDGLLETSGYGNSDETIQLLRKDTGCNVSYGSYDPVNTQLTGNEGEEGTVRFEITTDRNRCYRLLWDNGSTQLYSAPIPVTVVPITRLTLDRTSVRRKADFKATVTSNKAINGRVRLQYRYGSTWYTIKTITVSGMTRYTMRARINRSGRFPTRASFDRMVTSGGFPAYEPTTKAGPYIRVNDLWCYYAC